MDPTERVSQCLENTVIFTMASFQYTGLAFALSIGPPYRKPTYTNCEQFPQLACKNFSFSLSLTHTHTVLFLAFLGVLSFCNVYMILTPGDWLPPLLDFMGLLPSPSLTFRVGILLLDLVYIAVVYLLEVCGNTALYMYRCLLTFILFLSRPLFCQADSSTKQSKY